MKKASTWGAVAGLAAALIVLAALSFMLLDLEGANYKVLVAVWLWLLPVTGVLAGGGYAAGSVIQAFAGRRSSSEGGSRANTR